MKVLGINGSPRIGGNTDILLDRVLEGASSKGAETEKVILNKLRFSPCQECENMRDDGTCIIEDDMQPLYGKVEDANAVILASPIFFGSISAQTKMMIDRFQCLWRAQDIHSPCSSPHGGEDWVSKKKGYFISVEASTREDFFDNASSIVKNLFVTIGAEYKEELFCSGIDRKVCILKHPDILKKAFELGKRIVSRFSGVSEDNLCV